MTTIIQFQLVSEWKWEAVNLFRERSEKAAASGVKAINILI